MARRAVPRFEDLESEYRALWDSMEIRPEHLPAISAIARKIVAARARYAPIEAAVGVPWYVVGIIHQLEAGGLFDRHLHNGDPLARRTVQVPAGRPAAHAGPFTFEESAIDALLIKSLDKIARWDVPRIAYELERYNGFGYRTYHPEVASPYLWSRSTHYTRGKYVADGKWSATAVSGQSGAMPLLKRIAELCPDVILDAPHADPAQEFTPTPEPAVKPSGQITAASLAGEGSRSMSLLVRLRNSLGLGGTGLATFLGLDSFSTARGTLNELKALLADHAALAILGALGLALGVVLLAERYLLAAARDGRYRPRGG